MRSVGRYWLGALAVVTIALGGCDFSDVVEIGSDQTAGRGAMSSGGRRPNSIGGRGGMGGSSGMGGSAGTESLDNCGVGSQFGPVWVEPTPADGALVPGSGGPFERGEYRLRGLLAHAAATCFEPQRPLAQTLLLRPDGTGSVVSDYDAEHDAHFVTAFQFDVENNSIVIRPTCSEPAGPGKNPFGPFETYTAVQGGLVLVSAECGYRADYAFMPVPAR